MEAKPLLNKRYQLFEPLGRGGMAVVYRARDLNLERYVAIKVLREDYSRDPDFQDRFRQEARAAANLSHPNIITVHDFGLDGGQLFIVMEYVSGMDLKSMIQKHGRFSLEEALPLMIQACSGVGYAHRAGLVHCDVKPQNILVTADRRLKVGDFGIARALSTIRPDEQSDVVWGSPQYYSPEQAAGGAPSPASDVYSLGIILYEMLTGELPFPADTAAELARMHLEDQPPLISTKVPGIPPALEQILLKVLSKEPSARYRTADQLGRVLLNFVNAQAAPALALTPEVAPQAVPRRAANPTPTQPKKEIPASQVEEQPPLNIDWVSAGLGLLALLAVGGLIPFWLWVYFIYNPPIR